MSKPIPFEEILDAFEFVNSANGENQALVAMGTGKILLRSEISGLNEFDDSDDESADDNEFAGPFISIPNKRDLDLGKPLALAFARECLPDAYDEVAYIFGGRGAYRNFKALLQRRRVLDRWYEFEAKATEGALREWCELKKIEVEG